jgi:acetyl-CoA synthetase
LILTADDAAKLAARVLQVRYPEAQAGFAAGSFVRGGATGASDLDLVVLFAALPNAWRESFVFEGVPVDVFVHDPETLRAFMLKDVEAGKPAMLTMLREARIVGPNPSAAAPLRAEAEATYAKGPPRFDDDEMNRWRYLISSRVEDLEDPRPWPEMVATGAWLHAVLADFILRANGRWAATAKWIPRALTAFDPDVEARFTAAFDGLFERRDVAPVIAFADELLAPFGGRLFAGYAAKAKPDERVRETRPGADADAAARTEALRRARDLLIEHRTDYAAAYAAFAWPRFERFNFALDWFDVVARERDCEALRILSDGGPAEVWTYGELAAASNRLANFLSANGLKRGDALLLMLGNEAPLWVALLAAMKLGAVVIPTSTLLSGSELDDRLSRGAVRFVIAAADLVGRFPVGAWTGVAVGGRADGWLAYEDAAASSADFTPDAQTNASDPLLLYFTSGTTSRPKLVLHSHVSYPVGHLSTLYWLGLMRGDRHLNISSPGWAKHAWSCVFTPWLAEASAVVLNQARFDAAGTLADIRDHAITTFCAPPTVWRLLIQHDLGLRPPALRELISAGEPLNPEVIEQVEAAWGLLIRDGYGQTETTAQVGNTPGQPIAPGAMGRPLPGYRIVVDGEGDEGEICLPLGKDRPLGLMQGYWKDGALEPLEGGVYRTGDVVSQAADGVLTYVGRADDVFKASDYRISPFELESVLIEHPAVAEAAVVPSPDPMRLAFPKAFVVLAAGAAPNAETAKSILAHARERLGPFKRVRRLEVFDLPKTISGKIRRVELRALEADRRRNGVRGVYEWWEEDFR